jgi:hypothetical protein
VSSYNPPIYPGVDISIKFSKPILLFFMTMLNMIKMAGGTGTESKLPRD